MSIFKYEVINPVVDTKRPFFNEKKGLFIFNTPITYRYYVECAVTNADTGGREYYILLGKEHFDSNCRLCQTDGYGRCKIRVKGELKDYIISETKARGNIDISYVESEDTYDIYAIN